LPQVSFVCGYESLELTLLIARAFDQKLCVVSQVGELFGSKP